MIRRALFNFLAATIGLSTIPSGVYGADAVRIFRIGILIPESALGESQTIKGIREQLRDLGYIEGKNLVLDLRDLQGDRSALYAAASELVNKKVDVLFATGSRATEAAKVATKQIPIVFRHPADPVAVGLLKNMKRPDGNVTGVAAFSSDMNQKRLEILKTIVPKLRKIHIFYDANSKYSAENLLPVQQAAAKLRLEVVGHPIKASDGIENSLEKLQAGNGEGIVQVPDDLVESQASFLFDAAKKLRLATMFDHESWAIKGSLATYGPNYARMGRQAAEIIDKLLKGAKPKDVPVQAAGKFDLVINLRTAHIIGLNIPSEVLDKADRVIR